MRKYYFVVILLTILLFSILYYVINNDERTLDHVDEKEMEYLNSLIEQSNGKGLMIQPEYGSISWASIGIQENRMILNELLPTLKVKGKIKSTFESKHYVRCTYENIVIFISLRSKNPESEVIGLINNKYYLLEAGKSQTDRIVYMMKESGFGKSIIQQIVDEILNYF